MVNVLVVIVSVLVNVFTEVSGHGRMVEPPMRSSAWRYGFATPKNYNDNELNCGGFSNQMRQQGRCGPCGDPWQGPRDNEIGGKYAVGVITRHYTPGQTINVTIELTTNHKGYFEFRLCPKNAPNIKVTQSCLDRYLLNIMGYGTRYEISTPNSNAVIRLALSLPPGVTCSNCVLQWKWRAAQNRGPDGKGGECFGCGPQEHFINCADVAIGRSSSRTASLTMNPNSGAVIHTTNSGTNNVNVKSKATRVISNAIHSVAKPEYNILAPTTVSPVGSNSIGSVLDILSMLSLGSGTSHVDTNVVGMGMNTDLNAVLGLGQSSNTNNVVMVNSQLPELSVSGGNQMSSVSYTSPRKPKQQTANTDLTSVVMSIASRVSDGFSEPENYESCPCKGHNTWNKEHNFDNWCSSHCPMGQCPSAVCTCSCLSQAGSVSQYGLMTSSVRCKGISPFGANPSMDDWCSKHCGLGGDNCPSDFCLCE